MQTSITSKELMTLVLDAQAHVKEASISSMSVQIRLAAMERFVRDARARAPQKVIQISMEDYLFLVELGPN